jgi:hypothetical protein
MDGNQWHMGLRIFGVDYESFDTVPMGHAHPQRLLCELLGGVD